MGVSGFTHKLMILARYACCEPMLSLSRSCFFHCPQMKFVKVMFLHLSVSHPVHRGACEQGRVCMAGSVHGRGHLWQRACMAGGLHDGECAWQGVCMVGGVHGGGHAWQGDMCGGWHVWQGEGVCVAGGMHGRGHAWHGGMHGMGACMAWGHAWWERLVGQ